MVNSVINEILPRTDSRTELKEKLNDAALNGSALESYYFIGAAGKKWEWGEKGGDELNLRTYDILDAKHVGLGYTGDFQSKPLFSVLATFEALSHVLNEEDIVDSKLPKIAGGIVDDLRDIGKGVKRGWRDLVKGEGLGSEMQQRIVDEILTPARELIEKSEPRRQDENRKEDALEVLDEIQNRYLSSGKGRGE